MNNITHWETLGKYDCHHAQVIDDPYKNENRMKSEMSVLQREHRAGVSSGGCTTRVAEHRSGCGAPRPHVAVQPARRTATHVVHRARARHFAPLGKPCALGAAN